MKKIITSALLFSSLLVLAQGPPPPPGIESRPFPYTDDFESYPINGNVSTGGWSASSGVMLFSAYTGHGAGTPPSKGLTKEFFNSSTTAGFCTPKVLNIGNNAELRFQYRMAEYLGATALNAANLPSDFSMVISASTDSGANYMPLATINAANNQSTLSFGTFIYSLSAYANQDLMIKIVINRGSSGDFFVDIDNFSIDITSAIPTSNVSENPVFMLNGRNIIIQNIPSSFDNTRITLYDITGSVVDYQTQIPGTTTVLQAPSAGVYFVSFRNAQKQTARKVIIQ
ncbi:MAG: T9SS type A sorting domain-containing protein [Bacteroidota bacterium]|jgi:hypothetical protein